MLVATVCDDSTDSLHRNTTKNVVGETVMVKSFFKVEISVNHSGLTIRLFSSTWHEVSF